MLVSLANPGVWTGFSNRCKCWWICPVSIRPCVLRGRGKSRVVLCIPWELRPVSAAECAVLRPAAHILATKTVGKLCSCASSVGTLSVGPGAADAFSKQAGSAKHVGLQRGACII